jgi:hypothetical protein
VGIAGWIRHRAATLERLLLVGAGVLLFFPQPLAVLSGGAVGLLTVALHWRRH